VVNAGIALVYACVFAWVTRFLAPTQAVSAEGGFGIVGKQVWSDARSVFTERAPLALMCSFAAYAMSFNAIFGFLPILFIDEFGFSRTHAVLLTAGAWTGNIVGTIGGGFLRNMEIPRWLLLLIGSTVMGLSSIGIYSADLATEFRYVLCILFATVGGIIPASVTGAIPVFAPRPDLIATVSGFIIQGANLGLLLGPPTLALIVAASGGWTASPLLTASCGLIGAGLALYIGALERGFVRSSK
jgi:hypothetical protein